MPGNRAPLGPIFCHSWNWLNCKRPSLHCFSFPQNRSRTALPRTMQIDCHFFCYSTSSRRESPANCRTVLYSRGKEMGMDQTRANPRAEHLGVLYRVSRALLKEGEYG